MSVKPLLALSPGVPPQVRMCLRKQEPFGFANLNNCVVQNGSLRGKVWQEETLRARSCQSARLFFYKLPGTCKEGTSSGISSLGLSLHFALSEKPGRKPLITHSTHVLPINIWLMLYLSCFRVFCNYLFIGVHKINKWKGLDSIGAL